MEADEDGFYVFSIAPDILVHQRKTDANNLLVIEVKKRSNPETEKYDLLKLELFTKSKADKMGYAYKFGAWVVAEDECQPNERKLNIIAQYQDGKNLLGMSKKGKIPNGWRRVAIKDMADSIQYGLTASAAERKHGPRFLRITDIQDGRVDWSTVPSCDIPKEQIPKYKLSSGDLVFARTGATTEKVF